MATNPDGERYHAPSTDLPGPSHGQGDKATDPQSDVHTDPELLANTPQHHDSVSQSSGGSPEPSSTNEPDNGQSHQRTEPPYRPSSLGIDRDLERGEPFMSPQAVSPTTAGSVQGEEEEGEGEEEGQAETTGTIGSSAAALEPSLVQSLKSTLGESKYRQYAMGCGRTTHHSFLLKKAVGNIAIWSSSEETWWPLRYVARILQHLVSRWVHSGFRKHFETFHPRLHDGTAVHLLQNIGNPSDYWISETLKEQLGLDTVFLSEHLALIYDGIWPMRVPGSPELLRCGSAWHVRATLSDQPMLQFDPLTASSPPERAKVVIISFQQTNKGSFLVLLNTKTNVPLTERLKEFLRARDTLKRTYQYWSRRPRRSVHARTATKTSTSSARVITLLNLGVQQYLTFFPFMPLSPLWWVFVILFIIGGRPINPQRLDHYGEVAIEWPNTKRTFLRRQLRPPQSQVFDFMKQWLLDPVHVKALTYMTSNIAPGSKAYKDAEERCIWLLNCADWKHEVQRLSTEAELLDRQVLGRSNLNVLRRLVQCRKTAKEIQDGIKNFLDQTLASTIDWTPVMQSWADQEQARVNNLQDALRDLPSDVLSVTFSNKGGFRRRLIALLSTLQAERNPIDQLYWQRRTEEVWTPGRTSDLMLEHVDNSLKTSLSLLQDAIAVQTSDRALWLALIATFYFPATLATGIFGMNLSLIDGKPYWWAIVICAILFIPNVVFLMYVFWRR